MSVDDTLVRENLCEIFVELTIESDMSCVQSGYVPSKGVDAVGLFDYHVEASRG